MVPRSGVLRRRVWLIVACAAAGAAAFGVGSALRPPVYESTATVRLDPIWIPGYFDTPDVEPDAERDMAREVSHVRADLVEDGIETQFSYDMTLDVRAGDEPDEIVFVGTSFDGGLAENVPRTAIETYLDVRASDAEAHANAAVAYWADQVASLEAQEADAAEPSASLATARQHLTESETRARDTSARAEVVEGPTDAADRSAEPWLAALFGALCGLLLGLALAFGIEASPRFGPARHGTGAARAFPAWAEAPRVAVLLLGALVVGRAAIYAAFGPNFILDDWSLVGFREFNGITNLVPTGQDLTHARPGAWLTFTVIYGAIGAHPLLLLAALTAINVGLAIAAYAVLARFLRRPLALLTTVIWVLLPTHGCITVWTGTSQVAVSLLLLLLGMLALTHGRWLLAGLALAASILCYELTTPACLLAPLLIATPLVPVRPEAVTRTLTWWRRLVALAMAGAAALWVSAHSIYPLELRWPDVTSLWNAHFGIGLYGSLATENWVVVLTAALVAGAVAFAVVRWLAGDRDRDAGPTLVMAGLGVMAIGLGVSFTIVTSPLGFGDRLYAVSGVGSGLMLAGVLVMVWEHSRTIAVTGALGLTAIALIGQVVSLRSWSQAGDDVIAALHYIDTAFPEPDSTHFIVGPQLQPRNGVQGASSPFGGAEMAYRLQYPDGTGSMVFANTPDEFVADDGQTLIEWSQALAAP